MNVISIFKKPSSHIILLFIWLLSFGLRIYHLGSLPFNFMEDEVLSGYVGRYILQNGIDLYGNEWPLLFFDKFGDFYIIGPMYLSGLSTYLFGITEFAVRFPAALLGSMIVFPIYYFVKNIFRNTNIGLLSALLVSLSPWHIILSRSTVEGIIGSSIFLSALVLLVAFIYRKKYMYFFIAIVLFFISYFIYHPFRMYTPLIFLPIPLFFPKLKARLPIFGSIIAVFILFAGLTYYISTTPWGSGRFHQTSIFSELSGVSIRIQEQIYNVGEQDIFRARLFHNKVIGYGREFIRQYISYFSPNFLFTNGGAESRYDVPDQGLLYLTYLALIIIALSPLKAKKIEINNHLMGYFFYLLLIAPLPAAVTYYGSPNIHRSLFLGILLIIPAAYGAYKLWFIPYRKIVISIVVMVLLGEFIYFWHQYSVQSDKFTAMRRNDAHRELMNYLQENSASYEHIYLPAEGATSLYYLFFTKNFSKDLAGKFHKDAYIKSIDNITFIESSCPTENPLKLTDRILIVNRHNCPEKPDLHKVATIKGKNELLGFTLYESK
ncbi:MAG: glycosyltransferase family 39 protein [bacterium]|nr:glycosyltransferase family 39 protein [bacterium]